MMKALAGAWIVFAASTAFQSTVSFKPEKDIAGGSVSGVSCIDAGKIDNDNLADVLVVEGGKHAGGRKTFAWFKSPSNPQNGWTRRNISHGASLRSFLGSAKLADFDNDGDLDIALSSDNHSGGSKQADILVFVNPGGAATGTWNYHRATPSTMAWHHVNDMEIADIDVDGKKDIIVRSLDPNQIHIFFQNSISSWTRKTINTGISASEGLSVGKIDGDNRPDITFTGYWLKTPSNARTGSYTQNPIDSNYKNTNQNTKESTGDIDGDGRIDIVIGPAEVYRGGANHVLAWYKNPGSNYGSNWQRNVIRSNTNNHHTVKLADFDNDGDLDILTGKPWSASGIPKESLIFYNNGSGGFSQVQTLVSGKGLYTGVAFDIGNDGDLDVVGQDSYAGSSKPWLYESNHSSSTPSPPAAPGGLTATAVSESRINLSWTDNANNEDDFQIQRATSSGGPWSQIAVVGANTTSYSNTGLSASTQYYYRVRARNAGGNSGWSNTANATTLAPPLPPPTAPSGLTATAVSDVRINLSWTDNSNNEDDFQIQRATSSGGPWSQIAVVGTNTTSYANTGLSASTQYYYRVRARNAAGNSSWSNTANATTQAPPLTPPTAPSGLSATSVSDSRIDLSWNDNASNEDDYQIQRATSSGGPWSQIAVVGAGTTSYSNTGLSASTPYYYRVRARNAAGNSSWSNTANATTQAPPVTVPSAPIGLSATAASSTQIDLAWTDNANNEDDFQIQRATAAGGPWSQIAVVGAGATNYSNTGLTASTPYYYRVRARNAAGNSSWSNTANATTQAPPVTVPSAPGGLTATATSSSQIDLSWTDNANNEDDFQIQRASAAGGPWSQIAVVGADATSYSNSGLSASTQYFYRVRARNTAGNSSWSNTANATTLAPPVTPPAAPSGLTATATSSSQIDLSWTDASNNEDEFQIQRSTGGGGFTQIATVGPDVTSYSDTGLTESTQYSYRVRSSNSAGNSSWSNTAAATTLAGPVVLPPPWQTQDIGAVGAAGNASISGGTFTVDGSGADIWSTADEFRYVYQPLSGDGSVIARVVSQGNTDGWAKAGPMIRESVDPTSPHAIMALTPLNGATFDRRTTSGGTTSKTVVGGVAPLWVRLTRIGDQLTGYVSPDGISWTQVDVVTVAMTGNVLAGLGVTSHNDGAVSTAVFDNVMVIPGVDSDGDGMEDGTEAYYGGDTSSSDQDGNGITDGQDDWDGDGTSNYEEMIAGTDPGTPPGGATPPPGPGPAAPPAAASLGSEGGEGCGTTGADALLLLALVGLLRRRKNIG